MIVIGVSRHFGLGEGTEQDPWLCQMCVYITCLCPKSSKSKLQSVTKEKHQKNDLDPSSQIVSAVFEMISDAIFIYGVVSKTVIFLVLLKIKEKREALCLLHLAIYSACR